MLNTPLLCYVNHGQVDDTILINNNTKYKIHTVVTPVCPVYYSLLNPLRPLVYNSLLILTYWKVHLESASLCLFQ